MNQTSINLLASLSKWASGQQENFLSDAFVHLLNLLAQETPEAFSKIITLMTDGCIVPSVDSAKQFSVTSQISTDEGTPDIEISGPATYILIEVKDESSVYMEQVKRYFGLIEQSEASNKKLLLLTKYPAASITGSLVKLRWTQITEWLKEINDQTDNETTNYTVKQFIGFLEFKGMSVNKVGWEMVAGIEQLQNFKTSLQQAIESVGVARVHAISGSHFNGWAIPDKEGSRNIFDIFIHFDNPGILLFSCVAERVVDRYKDEWFKRGRGFMGKSIDLNSEETYFFSRGLDSQRELLEDFVSSCLSQTTYESEMDE